MTPSEGGIRQVLVAGIGNMFLGDDGFGVEVARRLQAQPLPPGVHVVDFGIRGIDLAFALQGPWDLVVLVDAAPRGGRPGTLYVLEADAVDLPKGAPQAHTMDPVRALALARSLGAVPPVVVVACEPGAVPSGDDVVVGLSEPVERAVTGAIDLVAGLVGDGA